MAYLDLTPLTDLCNQPGGRAHRANDCSSPEEYISDSSVPRGRSHRGLQAAFSTEPEGSEPTPKAPVTPVGVTRVSMRAAAQRPTQTCPDTPLSPTHPPRSLEPPRAAEPTKVLLQPPARTVRPSERPEVPSAAKKPPGQLLPSDRRLFAARERLPKRSRLLREPEVRHLDGQRPLDSRRLSPVGRQATGSERGDSQRS
jgi:hypothetical protein